VTNNLSDNHVEGALSANPIEDYKKFLLLHIDSSDNLRVYPIGVNKMAEKWQLNPQEREGQP
jgi:hypothetical protein